MSGDREWTNEGSGGRRKRSGDRGGRAGGAGSGAERSKNCFAGQGRQGTNHESRINHQERQASSVRSAGGHGRQEIGSAGGCGREATGSRGIAAGNSEEALHEASIRHAAPDNLANCIGVLAGIEAEPRVEGCANRPRNEPTEAGWFLILGLTTFSFLFPAQLYFV